jgi:protein-L-isoaspartate(D-aspartate) O-methyltransferase
MQKDSYQHKGLRRQLVETIKKKGVQDERILNAFLDIPRHFFLDDAFAEWAYQDKPFPIGCEQTISQPYTVAYQTELLEVKSSDKILEVGTGSGFQAAVLHYLGAKVYTIERFEALFHKTNKLLKAIGMIGIRTFHGDGMKGLSRQAPFDKIIVTAAAPKIPKKLLEQLKIGGIMVVPVGEPVQTMYRIIRKDKHRYETKKMGSFRFVPLLEGKR